MWPLRNKLVHSIESYLDAALRSDASGVALPAQMPPAVASRLRKLAERLNRAESDKAESAKNAERAQAEADYLQVRFNLITQGTSDGLWDMRVIAGDPVNPKNEFWWAPQFRRLLGFEGEHDFPNVLESWSSRLHPDDAQRTLDAFAAHLNDRSGGTPYDVRYRLQRKSGEYRWFRAHGETLRDRDGVPLRVAGSLTDITEQVERDQQLDVTLTRFELSSVMLNDGLWDMSVVAGDPVNPKNEFWWAQQFRNLLGFEGEHDFPNIFESWSSRLHPEDKQRALDAFAAHLNDRSGGTPYDVEYRLQLKNGQYRWFRARGQTKRAADGTPLRAVGALTDIQAQKQLGAAVQAIRSAVRELSSGNEDLSRRTEQQAAALEETASSMEQMTANVRRNSDSAAQANQLVVAAMGATEQGSKVVGDMVTTMSAISDSSRKIADITGVIDGIAFQTNILALNAAVEAARAGEQGRGFAVVASEVRNLAQRCGVAAKEIRGLISDAGDKVGAGMTMATQAGGTMSGLLGSIRGVTDIVGEIAAASREQAAGIEQVGLAITQMDSSTQENAALVEQMTAAARALEAQADELVRSIGGEERPSPQPARQAAGAAAAPGLRKVAYLRSGA